MQEARETREHTRDKVRETRDHVRHEARRAQGQMGYEAHRAQENAGHVIQQTRKVHSPFIDNIWGADLADMQLIGK